MTKIATQNTAYRKRSKSLFLRLAFTFAMMMLCVFGAKGQEGYWFFANHAHNNGNNYKGYYNAANFYMRPAEYWYNLKNGYTMPNDTPFITTYQTLQDEESSLWLVEKVSGQNYYTIKHVGSDMYLTVNDNLPGYSKTHRLRVHLEPLTTLSDRNYFNIASTTVTTDDSQTYAAFTISCQDQYAVNANKSLNPAGGNYNQLTPGNNETPNTGGMVGFYTIGDNGSKWVFEEVKPRISFTTDYKVQIAYPYYPSNASIYYTFTTDGSDPTDPTPSTGNQYTGPFSISASASKITVKAIAVRTTPSYTTEMTTFTSLVLPGNNRPYLFNNLGYGSTPHEGFYMQPGDVSSGETTVTTSSVVRPLMKWYFKSAGIDNGYQYFYIVNSESGNYLHCSLDGNNGVVRMKTPTDFDGGKNYKFRLIADASDNFRIVPMVQQTKWINKSYGNGATNAVNTNEKLNELACRWNIIPIFDGQMPATTAPFTVSDATTTAYYKIGNASATTYYIVPGTTSATTSSTEGDDMKWYFKEAGSDNWLTYYYIVNAVTGKYLYFCGDEQVTNNNNAFQTIEYSSENADRYQFVVANTTEITPSGNTPGKFYIVPRVLKDLTYTNYSLVWRDGTNPLKTQANRADDARKWKFTTTSFKCETPVITIDAVQGKATFDCATPEAKIYYVRYNDASGADPDLTDPTIAATLTCYTGEPVSMENYSCIKAIAARDPNGGDQSDVATETFQCIAPTVTFDNTTNIATIGSTTINAEIYYTTDESIPTTINYTNHGTTPVQITLTGTTTIKAFAVIGMGTASAVTTATIYQLDAPIINFDGEKVTMTCSTPGARIHYELRPSNDVPTPTLSSPLYTAPLTNVAGTYLKAIAELDGWITSPVAEAGPLMPQCATPVISRGENNTFTIECSFPANDVTIYYTTDNSITKEQLAADPTLGTIYTGAVSISEYPVTVKAIAVADDYNNSPVAIRTITEGLEPVGGWYEISSAVEFNLFVDLANSDGAGYNYRVVDDFTVNNPDEITQDFTGVFDGGYHVISGLDHAIFNTVNGGTVKNVMLKDVDISGSGNIGAICNEATGASRIYNCGILPTTTVRDGDGNITGFEGSTVGTSSGSCGSLVGLIDGQTRVINCFSYANITNGGGTGNYVGGLVGNNNQSSSQTDLRTIVVNCIFYGDIDTDHCTNFAPVYGNNSINNGATNGINPYDFFRENATFDDALTDIAGYKRSWPAKEEYLTRFEYYRSILNSNRQLMAWWVSGSIADTALIAKWVLDPEKAPYPILKKWGKYPSIINPDPARIWDSQANSGNGGWQARSTAAPYRGKSFGTLSVTVNPGTHAASGVTAKTIPLTITDMDTLNYDYCYYKVQLPYYNEQFGDPSADPSTDWDARYGGNYKDYVVTGWKVTSIPGGVTSVTNQQGTDANGFEFDHRFVQNWESGYNFADRYCTDKDLFSKSGRVFAQGGFFYVPEGVSAITIEAYWGKAVYLQNYDNYLDRVNITTSTPSGALKLGDPFILAGTLPATFTHADPNLPIYDSLPDAIKHLDAATLKNNALDISVYDQAIVLLSNLQWRNENNPLGTGIDSKWHPFTFMSIDRDMDNEPDYCFEFQFRQSFSRPGIQPIRFDFLPVPELGLAVRHDKDQNTIGIFVPQGHFEITETSYMHTTQFEYDALKSGSPANGVCGTKVPAPVILNGGHFEQIVVRFGPQNTTQYFIMGGHFRMLRFTPGAHTNRSQSAKVRLCAVNAIGGEYPEFYLSGIYRPDIVPTSIEAQGNPHCYTNGGKFGIVAGAGYDKILGNVTFEIDHSIIREFYGGGINGTNPVGGDIDVVINHSLVLDKYCGGPKVGPMEEGKTVKTYATGTTFNKYYGGGNGGTSYYRDQGYDGNDYDLPSDAAGWNKIAAAKFKEFNPLNTINGLTAQYDDTTHRGYHALYEFECFVSSNGLQNEKPTLRTYTHWAEFGTTSTGNTTSFLDDCTVRKNFYGGGNLGNVNGTVTSTLKDCTMLEDVFGGGYSSKIEPFRIYDKSNIVFPSYDKSGVMVNSSGKFTYVKDGDEDRYYTWSNETGHDPRVNPTFQGSDGKWYVYTTVSLEGLGEVSSNVTLTLTGNTVVGHNEGGNLVGGNVFGGGDMSAVNGSATVTITGTSEVKKNVFGGGNAASVGVNTTGTPGNTTVNLQQGAHVLGNVYGGGNEGEVGGNSEVIIQNPAPNP